MTATTGPAVSTTLTIRPVCSGAVRSESGERVVKTLRIEPELWEELGEAGRDVGMDRSALLRQLARWYVGIPGAQLPPRPHHD